MEQQKYNVKTEVFEGPLDLLLSLIEKRKLFINDISLAKVADDYIEYINRQSEFPMLKTADFILVASTLLLIKSKSLLPSLSLTQEEEGSIEDLELRLKVYKRIKELSRHVRERFGEKIIFAKCPSRAVEPLFSPSREISVKNIVLSVQTVLSNLPKAKFIPKAVVEKAISLEEMIDNLTERINKNLKMSFKEFSGIGKVEKVNIIISFLAMLELVKQGIIKVAQDRHFSDITMETDSVGIPKYE
jgi:segregation and condensation protein A